ncbi:MAG: glycosyltransferase, partial [Actinobacteria bacterium]|nr:glycosyltransferase [Actinomycetota bacterium]
MKAVLRDRKHWIDPRCEGREFSAFNSQSLFKLAKVEPKNCRIFIPVVDYREYAVDAKKREPKYVTLSNVNANKGGELLKLLALSCPDIEFLGVKGGYGKQVVDTTIPNLTYISHTNKIKEIYAKTWVQIMPSKAETWGRTAVEAMSSGIPVVVIELKNPADLEADIWDAHNQLQTYKEQIPRLFYTNALLAVADGADARTGSLTADKERFLRWRSIDGVERDPHGVFGHGQTLIEGLFTPEHILEMIRYFTIFQTAGGKPVKVVCAYHQFYAVKKAFARALTASAEGGDGRGGLMWHTQGSGKSIEMACLAGMLATSTKLENPTIVLVTDRNNLDTQLYDTFVAAKALLRQDPELADSRSDLREKVGSRPAGGVIFTTIQKFGLEDGEDKFPVLADRRNVFVF